jgi:hypothetical protein
MVPLLEESIELARAAGDRMQLAATLISIGRMLLSHHPEDPRVPEMLREALELSHVLGDVLLTVECLEAAADLACRTGDPVTGAQLIGAAHAERERAGVERKPDELPFIETTVRELERVLGREAYACEHERGRGQACQAAVEVALECTGRAAARA